MLGVDSCPPYRTIHGGAHVGKERLTDSDHAGPSVVNDVRRPLCFDAFGVEESGGQAPRTNELRPKGTTKVRVCEQRGGTAYSERVPSRT